MSEMTARAWRPQQFKDFVGQEYIIASLKNSIQESRVAQGYLFSGPRGVGKTSVARVFSMALNCLDLKPSLEPCLVCKNCIEIREGRSLDVLEIDGASNRGIDDMREMRSNAQFMPSYSHYKIYIIDEVHMLTTEAFNAILKILEEPPSYLVFMFATTEVHKVKNTIRSRCQQFYLKRLTEEQIFTQLQKILGSREISFDPKALWSITRAADGSMRDAQSILDQALIFSQGEISLSHVKEILGTPSPQEFLGALDSIITGDATGVKELTSTLYARGEDLEFWVLQFLEILRGLLFFQYGAKAAVFLEDEMRENLEHRASSFSLYQTQALIDLFMELFRDIRSSEKEFFFFEGAFLKALGYRSFVNLQEIVEKLSSLTQEQEEAGTAPPIVEQKSMKPSTQEVRVLKPSPPKQEGDIEKLFHEWKQTLASLRDQKILLDVKKVDYSEKTKNLNIEFTSVQGKADFDANPELSSNLLAWLAKQEISVVEVVPSVKLVDVSKSGKKNEKLSKEKALELFSQELQATEIHEKS